MRLIRALSLLTLLASPQVGASDLFSEPVPGALAPPTAPSTTDLDGVKVKMSTAASKKSIPELKAHYRARFAQLGLFLDDGVNQVELPNSDHVTALDPDRMISWTVLLKPNAQGIVTVMLTSSELARKPPTTPPFAPLMPNATDLVRSDVEFMEAFTYQVPATPLEIATFYRVHFKTAGYQEVSDLAFARGNERIVLTISPGLSTRGVMLVRETTPGR